MTELQDLEAPEEVRAWVTNRPAWCEVRRPASLGETETLAHLGAGEREAILLAHELRADFLLIDEEDGRQAARSRALTVTGTLDVHFISSLPVLQRPACMAWADTRCVQIVGAES